MAYKSSTLAEIRRLTARINKSSLFPHGHTTAIAAVRGHDANIIRNALKGLPADPEAIRSIVEEAERLANLRPGKTPLRKIRQLSIAELYRQSVLPAGYSELVAEITGMKPNAVRYFIKNQIAGRTAYASSADTIEALYKISEMNDEWELLYRLEKITEKIQA